MPEDAAVRLVRALVSAVDEPSLATEMRGAVPDCESLAIVLEFGEGYRSAAGYAYVADGAVVPVSCSWSSIRPAVEAYLSEHYDAGERLPVAMLVQFDRVSGRYAVTFEDTDEERWKTRASNFRQMRASLRPTFD